MKRLLTVFFLMVSIYGFGQVPSNYLNIRSRYNLIAIKSDSGFHVPGYSTIPNIRGGVWNGSGNIGIDTVNNKFYFYSGGAWRDAGSTNYADSLRRSGLAVQMRKSGVWTNQFDLPDSTNQLTVGDIGGYGESVDGATIYNDTLYMQLFGSETPGLVPASPMNTTHFLRADGSWATTSGGSSYTYTQGLAESGGTVKLANNRNIEYITQPTTGAALATGWTAVSSPSYSVSDGKFVFSGGSNNYTSYIRNDKGVLSEGSTIEAYVIINSAGTTDQGVRIGWKSYNSSGYAHDVHAGYISGTGASNTGKAILYGSSGASSNYSDSARTSSNGDTLYYKLIRNGLEYRIIVENITKDWKLQKTVYTTPLGSPFVAHNSAYVSVIPGAGDYTVYGLKYTINAPIVTENYIVGNSITYGQSAASEGARYASRIGYSGNNIGSGGGADITQSVLTRVNEIIAIKPKRVLLMIGGNDILFGVSSATWKANYLAIRDSLINNGIDVVHLLPTPRTATDVSALKYYIDTSTTFRSDKVIDTWTPLYSGSGYSMATKYNYDNTHPNEAGMGQIAATINDALHYSNGSTFDVNKNLVAKNGYVWGQDAGTGSTQYKAGGLIAAKSNSTTEYLQLGYESDYAYLQGVKEGVEYTKLVLSPGVSSPRIGIYESNPSVPLDIKNAASGNTTLMELNHGGSFGAAGQEIRVDFQNAGGNAGRIASFVDDGGSTFGFKFYGTRTGGVFNTTPILRMNGEDSASTFGGNLTVNGRLRQTQGADVASAAGAITLGQGNTFEITGTESITLISNLKWQNGSEITLIFTSTATLTDGTANSGTDIGMELAGNTNFVASADDVITLVLCEIGGTQRWREKSRSIN